MWWRGVGVVSAIKFIQKSYSSELGWNFNSKYANLFGQVSDIGPSWSSCFFCFFFIFSSNKSPQCENSYAVLTLTTLWADSPVDWCAFFLFFFPHKIGFNQGDSLLEMSNSILLGKIRKIFQNVFCWNIYQTCLTLIQKKKKSCNDEL